MKVSATAPATEARAPTPSYPDREFLAETARLILTNLPSEAACRSYVELMRPGSDEPYDDSGEYRIRTDQLDQLEHRAAECGDANLAFYGQCLVVEGEDAHAALELLEFNGTIPPTWRHTGAAGETVICLHAPRFADVELAPGIRLETRRMLVPPSVANGTALEWISGPQDGVLAEPTPELQQLLRDAAARAPKRMSPAIRPDPVRPFLALLREACAPVFNAPDPARAELALHHAAGVLAEHIVADELRQGIAQAALEGAILRPHNSARKVHRLVSRVLERAVIERIEQSRQDAARHGEFDDWAEEDQ